MTASPQEVPPLRWGIAGTGGIAGQFAADLELLPTAAVSAVSSRRAETGKAFAARHGIGRVHTSYRDLAEDETVEAVYVATPHPMHYEAAMPAIEAGKAVLVEKAFTVNAAQAAGLIDAARRRGVFLMEAMWTRFLPHMVALRELIGSGRLGEICTVTADHGQYFPDDPAHRLFSPELGGGALLDLGIYPLSFASMVLGTPDRVVSLGDAAFTGVDAQVSMLLGYPAGAQAVLTTTLLAHSQIRAAVIGRAARAEIDPVWYAPSNFTIVSRDGDAEAVRFPHQGNGLRHEAAEVARCVADGRLESAVMPLAETLAIMRTMDVIRAQGDFRLPADAPAEG